MPRYVLTALIVACALFMENLDGTVISTSLPAIARDLHEDPIALKLALTSYLLALAVFIPASGWVADRFGTRTVFRAAILVFTAGSIACGLSSSLQGFIVARIIQGMGGAMMVPVGRLVLLRSVDRQDLVNALSYLTVPALLGPMLGPPIGGLITTYFHWRYIFWINVPIGALGMILVTLFIDDIRDPDISPFDVRGFLLSGIGLSSAMFGMTLLGRNFVPLWVVLTLIVCGLVTMLFYIRHALTTADPILDLSLLRVQTFRASVGGGALFRIGIGAIPLLLPLMLQIGFGMTPLQSGLTTFVAAIGAMAMKTTASPILNAIGFRRVLVLNSVIGAAFVSLNSLFGPWTPMPVILAILLVGGFFRSLQFTGINAIAYADIDQAQMSRAVAFAAVAQQLALSIGVALGAGVVQAMRLRHGGDLTLSDFHWAFIAVALVSVSSCLVFARLPPDAGSSLRRREKQKAVTAEVQDARTGSALT